MKQHLQAAIDHVVRYGDTDIFPFPLEKFVFEDMPGETLSLLEDVHAHFDDYIQDMAPHHETSLSSVGYTGFRSATLIDPIWNLYFTALAFAVGSNIEQTRIAADRHVVFSYRFRPNIDEARLFDRAIGWEQFQLRSVKLAEDHQWVLTCDISDFYPRIYHHRLENALKKAGCADEMTRRLMVLLGLFSKNVSYGLPVGGPTARLLSELLLNRVDKLMVTHGITYCRYADDYTIFASSQEEAYDHLVFLSEKLLENEGLTLQKTKTRIISASEFLATSQYSERNTSEDPQESSNRAFMSLRLYFDPYSVNAQEEYETLSAELARFDIVGMLSAEVRKSQVDQSFTKKLIRSVKHLEPHVQEDAIKSLLGNLTVLYPVFSSVMLLLEGVIGDLQSATRDQVFDELHSLIRSGSYITRLPVNLAFAIRVLARDTSDETDELLASTFSATQSAFVRSDIIIAMANRNADYWVSDRRNYFGASSLWERRALICASYILADEGSHWRKHIKKSLSRTDLLVKEWASGKAQRGHWTIPL